MSDLLSEQQGKLFFITFNRDEKHNAFDEHMLAQLHQMILDASKNPTIQILIIKANGPDFSAGADAAWMQRMATFSEEENIQDAMILANMLHSLYSCPKPTIAMVHGAAYGGGAGIAAACDVVIAANNARFCFSEVKLGLIPAVISPYVINAIGSRAAIELFITANVIPAQRAYELQLIHHSVPPDELMSFTVDYADKIASLAPSAVLESKALVREIAGQPIDESLLKRTASKIAKKRISAEAQHGLTAFLNKKKPIWN